MWNDQTLEQIKEIAIAAGKEILAVYERQEAIEVSIKEDNSPLTEADQRAHNLIVQRLESLDPALPVLSEESDSMDYEIRRHWDWYWLVDPLDGTKEFIKRNGEFTVNIALIHAGVPVMGVVHVPVSGVSYCGCQGEGAWKYDAAGTATSIQATQLADSPTVVRVVASRSHRDEQVDAIIDLIEGEFGSTDVVSMGSSLKICLLADGSADIYPRLAPTSEWDTAAAHAVLSAAGGEIVDTQFKPLSYNQKADILNPYFIGIADTTYDWPSLLSPETES